MSLQDASTRIARAVRDFNIVWLEVQKDWKDQQARHFDESVLPEMQRASRQAAGAMDQMHTLRDQIRRDCL